MGGLARGGSWGCWGPGIHPCCPASTTCPGISAPRVLPLWSSPSAKQKPQESVSCVSEHRAQSRCPLGGCCLLQARAGKRGHRQGRGREEGSLGAGRVQAGVRLASATEQRVDVAVAESAGRTRWLQGHCRQDHRWPPSGQNRCCERGLVAPRATEAPSILGAPGWARLVKHCWPMPGQGVQGPWCPLCMRAGLCTVRDLLSGSPPRDPERPLPASGASRLLSGVSRKIPAKLQACASSDPWVLAAHRWAPV